MRKIKGYLNSSYIRKVKGCIKKIIDILSLSPDKGLETQLLFWLGIALPIGIAVYLGFPVWSEYSIERNELAYKKFIEVSTLPIGIASLAIPLGVLIGRLHGTKQTALQIENARIQIKNAEQDNKTKLYLSHFEHFCTHINFVESSLIDKFSAILPSENKLILNKLAMYKLIYPQNSLVNGVKERDLKEVFYGSMEKLLSSYLSFIQNETDTFVKNLYSLEEELVNIQLRCFKCQKTRESIFTKSQSNDPNNSGKSKFGISPQSSDYFPQVEFFIELLAGVESFEFNDPDKMYADKFLKQLRESEPSTSQDKNDLKNSWKDHTSTDW